MYVDGSLSTRWAGDFDIAGRATHMGSNTSLSAYSSPSFKRGPSTSSRSFGVSDEDWNEAREELVRLQRGPSHAGSEQFFSDDMRTTSGYDLPMSSKYNPSLVGSASYSHVNNLRDQRLQSGFKNSTEHTGKYSGYDHDHGSVKARFYKQGYESEHSYPYDQDYDLQSELSFSTDTRNHYNTDLRFLDHTSRINPERRTQTPELAKQCNDSYFDSSSGSRTPIVFGASESHGAYDPTRQQHPAISSRYGDGQSQARPQSFSNLEPPAHYSWESRGGNSTNECYAPTSRSPFASPGSPYHRPPSRQQYASPGHGGKQHFGENDFKSAYDLRYNLSGHSDSDILKQEDRDYSEGYSTPAALLYESRGGSQAPFDSYATNQSFTTSPSASSRKSKLNGLPPTRQPYHTEREQINHVTSQLDASLHRAFSKNSNVSILDDFFCIPDMSVSSEVTSHTPYSTAVHSPRSLISYQSSIHQLSTPKNIKKAHDIRRQVDKLTTMEDNMKHKNKLNLSGTISMPNSVAEEQQSLSTINIDAATFFNEIDTRQMELDRQRNDLEKQLSLQDSADLEMKLASEVKQLERQLTMLNHYREIDSNRRIAKLSRFGHVLSQPIEPASKASYLYQPRWLAAARKLSDRTPKLDLALSGGGIAGAYYHLLTNHLPRGLPFFGDRDGFFACGTSRQNVYVRDPFTEPIDFDYGYGRMKALGSYGLSQDRFARINTHLLDDLYLFEMLLRLDRSLDEQERSRRWRERLRWEEIQDSGERVRLWSDMNVDARRQIGIDEGSFWAAHLFGSPFNSRMGYTTCPLAGPAMRTRKHYSLTPGLEIRYPMWYHGGLGLGRRIFNWMEQPYRPINIKHELRRERIRREYAERRGEIRPRPRSLGPGLMGTGVPYQTELERLRRMSGLRPAGSRAAPNPSPSHLPSDSLPRNDPFASSGPAYPSTGLSRSSRPPTPYARNHPSSSSAPPVHASQPGSSAMSSGSNPSNLKSSPRAGTSTAINSTSTPNSDRPTNGNTESNSGVIKSPIDRNLTQSVVFDPYVEKISHEDTIPSRPPSRNQAGAALAPIRSAMKTPPANPRPPVPAEVLQDEQQIDSITAINTHRNRSTPAPDDKKKQGDNVTQKSSTHDPPKVTSTKVNPPKVNPAKLASAIKGARKAAEEEKGRLE
ncbi:uncharacterized protein MELLADRAFT_105829 [Melampsora larici-populina 98AG31]|uniref:Uncharacterized protein n=1 Tax=Melampsora larici-populina (strain 98AG31 / pathotype 3-4-7) TaxID=747676 RepID=F4RJG9_MELLP|nr:uncharacterized protein MELLADRAFT_105829 [Melampsora larici-populina 98AG31]EGG07309.1 hypothetical protein MELLADRAFT_105829 [Melampsora larici-populina 98AG31]